MTCTLYTQIPMYVCVHVCLATYIIKYKTLSHLSEGAASDPMHICYTHTHTHTHTHTLTLGGNTVYLGSQSSLDFLGLKTTPSNIVGCPCESYLTSLSPTFLICKMGSVI